MQNSAYNIDYNIHVDHRIIKKIRINKCAACIANFLPN